jgi:hypothetical protein
VTLAQIGWQRLPHARPLDELAYYPSGQHLRPATLGHAESAADLAWLRAVQYYGEHRERDNRFERMPHIFDILTTLSPRFLSAYVFGSFALAQAGGNFAAAESLMEKGLDANPTSSELAFQAGFLYYMKTGPRLAPCGRVLRAGRASSDPVPQAARFARSHARTRGPAGGLRVVGGRRRPLPERLPA